MPTYEVTFSATIKIEATNAAAAKQALKERKFGGIKLIGASGNYGYSPSGNDWHWNIQIKEPRFTEFRRTPPLLANQSGGPRE